MENIKSFVELLTPMHLKSTKDAEKVRDARIHFDEPTHTYTIDAIGSKIPSTTPTTSTVPMTHPQTTPYTSVTTWIHTLFPSFDADKIISNMRNSKKWGQSKYYGMTDEEIKLAWERNRDQAASDGTLMHAIIEDFYNRPEYTQQYIMDKLTSTRPVPKEIEYFCQYENDRLNHILFNNHEHLRPYRTEWTVFDEELLIAGSIDMIYESTKTGHLVIVDWKRCREIKKHNAWEYGKVEALEHVPHTNYWHYAIQLNLYRYILQRRYERVVDELWLVCMHPDNANQSYLRYQVPIMEDEIEHLVKYRLGQLK
jgi:ATP-dependent exoDNAse (exonuclease V) beta subunit